MTSSRKVILGSRSPQRLQLLRQLVPEERIEVCPPANSEEAGFDGLTSKTEILQQLASIVEKKSEQVQSQIDFESFACLLVADTIVFAGEEDHDTVLGQPDGAAWKETVRHWFTDLYAGKSHDVITAGRCDFPDESFVEFSATTTVRFEEVDSDLLEWYINTGEPLGKAGGYGIQSAGSLFVESIEGSLSNVIGLPLEVVWKIFVDHRMI